MHISSQSRILFRGDRVAAVSFSIMSFLDFIDIAAVEVSDLMEQPNDGYHGGQDVGDGKRKPNSLQTQELRHDEHKGNKDDELTTQPEQERRDRLAYALEEGCPDSLDADEGERYHDNPQGRSGDRE